MTAMSAPPRDGIPVLAELPLVHETARLRLRPFVLGDVDSLFEYTSDPALPVHMSWVAHTDKSQTAEFIRFQTEAIANGTGCAFAIEHAGRAVGCIALEQITWHLRAMRVDRAEVGYWLAPPLHGQGLMTEAGHAVMAFAYDTLGLHKLTIGCIDVNVGSRRVIEKLGFRAIGRQEDDVYKDGTWYAHLRYELTAFEWSDVLSTLRITRSVNRPRRT